MRTILVEVVPECLRESKRESGDWGEYPTNGAVRLRVGLVTAADLVADDPDHYNRIVPHSTQGCDSDIEPEVVLFEGDGGNGTELRLYHDDRLVRVAPVPEGIWEMVVRTVAR